MPGKYLSLEERKLILNLHMKKQKSYTKIAKLLSRSRSTIQSVIGRFKYESSVDNKPKSGRPAILTDADRLQIKRMIAKDPFLSAPKISAKLLQFNQKEVHPQTVRKSVIDAGFKSRTPRRKSLVNEVNRRKRLNFARQYHNASLEFWRNVIFSDESKYNIFGSDGRLRVWRKPGEAYNPRNTIKTVKHGGGGVMV